MEYIVIHTQQYFRCFTSYIRLKIHHINCRSFVLHFDIASSENDKKKQARYSEIGICDNVVCVRGNQFL